MRIGVDIRSLAETKPGGVTNYTRKLLEHLFRIDQTNEYILFSNSWAKPSNEFNQPNVRHKATRWPNKLFNSSIILTKKPYIDRLIGPIDLFFVPNINYISISSSCPEVITFHDLSFELYPQFLSHKRRLWHHFIAPRKLAMRANKIIAVSQNTRRDLIDLYDIPEDKIDVVYSGVETESIVNIKQSDINTVKSKYQLDKPYILTIGFLEPRKNISTLLPAFDEAKKRLPSSHQLIILGQPAWCQAELETARKKLKFGKDIRFIGYTSEQDKEALLKGAELFVYPSVYEGFGFPPIESIAAGTPVIASAASALPEVLRDSALFVQPYNTSELAQAIAQLIHQPELKEKLLKNRQDIINQFTWQKSAEETLNVFNNMKK
ncbi:glycosyltransferase family 4 protein [Patescibacteria group bacterium]|nr:glycosyltransferase family 4 protein [Patescibacteria group bacterium]MBU1889902.1 glycosyltransferase family 4 protein [Patescibacteria group bacterium]